MKINTYAITFGSAHNEEHRDVVPEGKLSEGFVVIEAPSSHVAREITLAIFGRKWAFDYPLDDFVEDERHAEWYPEGELLRIAWIPKGGMDIIARAEEVIGGSVHLVDRTNGERG